MISLRLPSVADINYLQEDLPLELGATMQRIKELGGRSDDLRGYL